MTIEEFVHRLKEELIEVPALYRFRGIIEKRIQKILNEIESEEKKEEVKESENSGN